MRQKLLYALIMIMGFIGLSKSYAQIETRLATQCALHSVEVPINYKNLENIKQFQLQLIFDDNLLRYDTSLYHQPTFAEEGESYKIKVKASNDTIFVNWVCANLDGISPVDGLMFSLVFEELGNGTASFQWIENNCFYKNKDNLIIDDTYVVDGDLSLPFETNIKMSFDQFQFSCRDDSESGGCKAQAEVNLEGGVRPYNYQWLDKYQQKDSIAIGLCQAPVASVVTDAGGCSYASLFKPVIYPAAVYEISANPEEVYITTPVVDFSIETDELYIETYLWNFGDEANGSAKIANPTYVYDEIGTFQISLKTENMDGCDTIVYLKNYEVKELNFCIPNVFTPNGDGINDTWVFKIMDGNSDSGSNTKSFKETGFEEVEQCSGEDLIFDQHFKSSHIVLLNRRGNVVFECNNCTDYWDGGGLPDGVYFYVFTWEGQYSNGKEQGNVTILGSGK
ncbi:MAG: hypothetical protein B7C24_14850 [Bacteroidetes bacterium 4572_77]|nr:MAG: hypothetical protein B7C24_14850 [Bacteroidetes bacterium 4572_77]